VGSGKSSVILMDSWRCSMSVLKESQVNGYLALPAGFVSNKDCERDSVDSGGLER